MLIALALAAASSTAAALAPTTKWMVEYAKDMCVLSRGYQADGQNMTLAFRPVPMGTETEIVLVAPGRSAAARDRQVEVELLPATSSTTGTYVRYSLSKPDQTLIRLTLGSDALTGIDAAEALMIRLDGKKEYLFGLPAIKAGMKALTTCQADLLRGWGVDPAEREKVVTPPEDNPAAWFKSSDYPSDAIMGRQQGKAVAVVEVDADGAAKACAIAVTSGSASLDRVTCEVLRRSRFHPGRDKDDNPVTAHVLVPIRWVLP